MRKQSHQHYPDPNPLYFTNKDLIVRLENLKNTYAQIETFGAPARFSEIETAVPEIITISF